MDSLTCEEAFDGWMMDLQQRRRTPRTREQYAAVVKPFLRWAAEAHVSEPTSQNESSGTRALRVSELTVLDLRRYVLAALAQHHPETQTREIGCIKTFGRWLEEQELVPEDPFRRVKKPKVDQAERRIITPGDAQAILMAFDKSKPDQLRDYIIVSLTLDTGLRISEVCGAKLADLNLEQGWLQVWGKGRKQRRVPISPAVKMLLWRWTKTTRKRWAKCDNLFVSRLGGPIDRHRLGNRFRAKVVQAGVSYRVRFHDLRHAAATWALRAGMPKERVSRMLGHANDSITSIYEHLDFEDVQEAHALHNPLKLVGGT